MIYGQILSTYIVISAKDDFREEKLDNSYAIQKNISCSNCGNNFNFEVWQIVDAVESPDLMEMISNGILHDAYCPQCKKLIIQIDSPLLVYRPGCDPVILFSKSEETTERQDHEIFQSLLTRLERCLGSNWPKNWEENAIPPLPSRTVLPVYLREGGQAAVLAFMQYQKRNNETRKRLAVTISTYINAKSIREIRTIVKANFSELTSFRAIGIINEIIESKPTEKLAKTLITRKHLLIRYREIGLINTLKELDEQISNNPEEKSGGGNFFSNLFNTFSNSGSNVNNNLSQPVRGKTTLIKNKVTSSSAGEENLVRNTRTEHQQNPEKVENLLNLLKEKNASAPVTERLSEEQLVKIAYRLVGDYKTAGEDPRIPITKMIFSRFDIDSQEGYSFQEEYGSKIRMDLVGYENIQIYPVNELVSQQDGSMAARNIGRQHRADIVVWGGFLTKEDNKNFRLNIESLTNRQFSIYKPDQKSLLMRQFGNISSFFLVQGVADKSTSILSFLEGLVLFLNSAFEQSIDCFNQSLAAQDWMDKPSNQSIVYYYRGLSHALLMHPDIAIADFSRSLEISPSNIVRIARANTYAVAQNTQKALDDFDQAIKFNPKDPRPFFNRGILFFNNQTINKAIEDFTKVINLAPKDSLAYVYRGLGYGTLQNHKKAFENFSNAIDLNPKCAEAYNHRGTSYTQQGEFTKAIPDFSRAILLDPNDEDSLAKRGEAYKRLEDYENAIADLTRAIDLNPDQADVLINRGASYVRKGELSKAIADYDRAISLNPLLASAYAGRGSIYVLKGEINQARQDVLKASQLNPTYISLYQSLEKM